MVVKEINWYHPQEWQPESFREIVLPSWMEKNIGDFCRP